MVKEGVYMNRISYNDIDFNKLTKLDYDSLESDIYIDKEKQRIYKIFKTEDLCELSYKLVKLDLLQRRNQKGKMIVPDTTIFDRHFCGTIEKYVPGVNLDDIFIKYRDINHIMKIFLDTSKSLQDIHEEKVVVADLNSANIRIDENDKSVIDIGCDHGLLSIYLAEKFNNLKIIASDVNNNALESARRNVSKYKLEDRIDIRLGSGVSVINKKDKIDTLVVAGMGANTIIGFLKYSGCF